MDYFPIILKKAPVQRPDLLYRDNIGKTKKRFCGADLPPRQYKSLQSSKNKNAIGLSLSSRSPGSKSSSSFPSHTHSIHTLSISCIAQWLPHIQQTYGPKSHPSYSSGGCCSFSLHSLFNLSHITYCGAGMQINH